MLPARWAKIINDLWNNKLRTVLIVLSISVGLFAVGTIVSTRSLLSTEMARSFAEINPSTGIVTTIEPFDAGFVEAVRGMREITAVSARRAIEVRVEVAPGEWTTLRVFAIADYDNVEVDVVRSISGAWPPPEREILIERSALALLGVQEGDELRLEMPSEQQRDLRVAGVAHDMIQIPSQFDGTPYGYISMETVTWLGEPYGFNELHVVAANVMTEEEARQVVNQVKNKAEKNGLTIPISMAAQPGQLPLDDILQSILALMGMIGLLSLFLSAFLIINTVSALLAQQKRQIGVMKAIGAGSGQLIGMYLAMVLVYGVLALVLAIPLSIIGARGLSVFLAEMFNFDLAAVVVPKTAVFLQIAIGLLVPVLASLYPFLANLRVSAADAMSSLGVAGAGSGRGWMNRLLSGANLWFARHMLLRPWLLSLRNTFRSKGRLAMTLITLTLAGAIFMSVFTVNASLYSTVDDVLSWWNFDTMLTLTRPYRTEKLEYEARKVPGVAGTSVWLQLPVRRIRPDGTESEPIFLFAPRPESELTPSPTVYEGRELRPDDTNAIVLNVIVLRDEPDINVGDEIILKVDGRERPFQVVGFSLGMMMGMAHANYDYISRLSGDIEQAGSLLVALDQHDEAYVNAKTVELESHFKEVGVRVSMVQTIVGERNEIESSFNILISLLLFMALLLAVVGGLGLMGTMSINVLERTREIGVLRAIGAPNQGVAQVFMREGIGIGVMSWALSFVFAFPLSKLLSDAVGLPLMGAPLIYTFSPKGVWLWLILVVLLSAVASFVPARNASRLTVREVLAYE
jgi:putative ABC transport system permease protein